MSWCVFGCWTSYTLSTTADANMFQGWVCVCVWMGEGWRVQRPRGGSAIGQAPQPETSSHLRVFPLSPHAAEHGVPSLPLSLPLPSSVLPPPSPFRVPYMLCLSGHLDVHLVSQRLGLSILAPDGLALITAAWLCVSPSRAGRPLDLERKVGDASVGGPARATPGGQKNKLMTWTMVFFRSAVLSLSTQNLPPLCTAQPHRTSQASFCFFFKKS